VINPKFIGSLLAWGKNDMKENVSSLYSLVYNLYRQIFFSHLYLMDPVTFSRPLKQRPEVHKCAQITG